MKQIPYSKEHCYVYNFKEGIDGNRDRSEELVNQLKKQSGKYCIIDREDNGWRLIMFLNEDFYITDIEINGRPARLFKVNQKELTKA